jgi:nucleoside-diphosphate-sugar epimerase
VTINGLIDLVCDVAGKKLKKQHDPSKPQGVRGRNSDNTLLNHVLGWEPKIRLEEGLKITYKWIEGELRKAGRLRPVEAGQATR